VPSLAAGGANAACIISTIGADWPGGEITATMSGVGIQTGGTGGAATDMLGGVTTT